METLGTSGVEQEVEGGADVERFEEGNERGALPCCNKTSPLKVARRSQEGFGKWGPAPSPFPLLRVMGQRRENEETQDKR